MLFQMAGSWACYQRIERGGWAIASKKLKKSIIFSFCLTALLHPLLTTSTLQAYEGETEVLSEQIDPQVAQTVDQLQTLEERQYKMGIITDWAVILTTAVY